MIYTLFPEDEELMPLDFPTYSDAEDYANECLDCDYYIESIDGDYIY